MKRKTMKKMALVMAVAVAATTALAGCGSSGEKAADGTKTETTGQETAGGTTAAGTDTTTAAQEKTGKVTVMTYDRGTMANSEGTLNDNRWTTWIRENAPVKDIEFIAIAKAEAPQTMNNLFASGEGPDVVANYEDVLPFIQNGMAMEITDEMLDKMPNYKMILDKYPALRKLSTVDGKLYTTGKMSNVQPNHTIVIRKDWLDKLGLEIPTTPEELLAVAEAFTHDDPDGNGIDDTYGISMTTDTQRWLSHMWGFPNPEKYAMVDGELTYVWDRIESWLDYSKQFVDKKLVNPDFMTMKGDDDKADFLNGKVGIYASGKFSQANTSIYSDFKKNNPDGYLDTFAMPETKYGKFIGYMNGGPSLLCFINSQTKNLDAALAYINWLYDPEVSEYLMYGPDGVYNKKDEEGTYTIVDAEKNAVEFNYASDYSIIKNEFLDGSKEPVDRFANDYYNKYLKTDDPVQWEFGDIYYKMCEIANDPEAIDPRKWQQGLPALPSDLLVIKATANSDVDNILKAALGDSSKSAAAAVEEAKNAWYGAGGQKVEDYYKAYYKEAGSNALLAEDFQELKAMPSMLESAKKNSKLFQ